MGLAGGQLEHDAGAHLCTCSLDTSSGLRVSLPAHGALTPPGLVMAPIAVPAAGASACPPTASQDFCVALPFLDPGPSPRGSYSFSTIWFIMQAVYKNLRIPY